MSLTESADLRTSDTNRPVMNGADALPPFPEGWYFVASRESILREKLIEKTWLGEEIVVWCDDAGRVCVADAVCPHLGSHLGPEVGGKICNGRLVCPFHGFEYDTTGQCVATPNAPAPRAARLKVYETREILGMVFAWFGSGGRSSQWDLPAEPATGQEWCELRIQHTPVPWTSPGNNRELCRSGTPALCAWLRQCESGRFGNGRWCLFEELLRLQTRSQDPGCKGPRVRNLSHHPRLWTGLLLRRNPRKDYRYECEIVGTRNAH